MNPWLFEIVFWSVFLLLNGLNYLINYIFYVKESDFLPIYKDFKEVRTLGLTESQNFDMFRFVVEFSILIILSRVINFEAFHLVITSFYFIILLFNVYQYAIRRTYHTEPVLFNDLKLLKNGVSIVWHESPGKVLLFIILLMGFLVGLDFLFQFLLAANFKQNWNWFFLSASIMWMVVLYRSLKNMKGAYVKYPNDIYIRFHFTLIELFQNLKRSRENRKLSKKDFGSKYSAARQSINIELKDKRPNVFFLFIESYGSYFFNEPALKETSHSIYEKFQCSLEQQGFKSNSALSTSTTFGGQSWLAYSSVLYGYKMNNNTLFENHLHDPLFREGNSLLHLFKKMGYHNYNLNPINPVEGINVPYEEMREFYAIDQWILANDINYNGDEYGWGACAPDQYSMNFMMDLIKKQGKEPFTYFYLTKNSHSPFLTPEYHNDWKALNNSSSKVHIHRGFLATPARKDYVKAIQYEFDVLQNFITDHGSENDIFLLIGDHQPPILSDENIHGRESPIHVISKNKDFISEFDAYGFNRDISKIDGTIRHEGFYSIFLNVFTKHFAQSYSNIPEYEPEGIQL